MVAKRSSSVGAVLFMVGAVIFAAVGGVLLSRLLVRQYPKEPVQPIVVAARDIRPGRPLRPEDLRQARWPQSSIPRGSFIDPKRVVKLEAVPLAPLVKGEAVLASHLARPRSGLGVAAKLERGERAMAFRTDASVTLAQLIYPGARVDLLTTMRRRTKGRDDVKTRVLLQKVKVLAVGPDIDPASVYRPRRIKKKGGLASIGRSDGRRKARQVVTVAVTPEQAERIVLAAREGKIDVVLRSPEDDTVVTTSGVTVAAVLGEPETDDKTATEKAGSPPRAKRKRPRRAPRRRPRPAPKPEPPKGPTIYRGGR